MPLGKQALAPGTVPRGSAVPEPPTWNVPTTLNVSLGRIDGPFVYHVTESLRNGLPTKRFAEKQNV